MSQILRVIKAFLKFFQNRDTQPKHSFPSEKNLRLSDYISPASLTRQGTQIMLLKSNLCLCLLFILIRLSLPLDHKYSDSVSSGGYSSVSDFFMISITFSFAGAFSAFLIRNKPKLAVLYRCYFIVSMLSMVSALSILAYVLFLESFGLVTSVIKLFQSEGEITSSSSAI